MVRQSNSKSNTQADISLAQVQREAEFPIFVDLDGTLIRGDLLAESLVASVRTDITVLWRIPLWLARGRAHLKLELAHRGSFDAKLLPYREDVLQFLRAERARGRSLVLVTASTERAAHEVAEHLGLFDAVLASNGTTNLKGRTKLVAIEEYRRNRGVGEFSYIGDSAADLPIWEVAHHRLAVSPSARVQSRMRKLGGFTRIFAQDASRLRSTAAALRPYQWVKNLLVFVPLLMDHQWSTNQWAAALLAFVSLCLCASAVYVLNDLLDVEADREHPTKRRRPFAAGDLPLAWGALLIPVLLSIAFGVAIVTSNSFAMTLLAYLFVTTLYSVWLKQKVLVDVLTLAGLYALRIFAGGVATDVVVSEWLTAFSFFLFTSLAFAKRYVELSWRCQTSGDAAPRRGYLSADLSLLETLGPTSGYLAVLILAMYVNSDAMKVEYHRQWPLWLICPLLMYWISRVWLHAKRMQLAEDPILFAFHDWVSVIVGLLTIAMWGIASWPG